MRPKKGLLQAWRDNFEKLYQQSELTPYYQEHILYRIFVHQSILSATILTMLKDDEMQDLGSRINFPMFLEAEPDLAREAVTLRYDEFKFFENPGWEEKVMLKEPLKKWLKAQIRSNKNVYKSLKTLLRKINFLSSIFLRSLDKIKLIQ